MSLQYYRSVPLGTVMCWVDKKRLSILKDRKSCQTGDFREKKKSVCAFVCWSKHTTTAACHFSQCTNGHLLWIKWYSAPLPSSPLCISHVVYSKVIFSMRVTAPLQIIEHLMSVIMHRAAGSFHSTFHKPFPLRSTFRWAVLKALSLYLLKHQWWNHSLMQFLESSLEIYLHFHWHFFMTCPFFQYFMFLFRKSDSYVQCLLFPEHL